MSNRKTKPRAINKGTDDQSFDMRNFLQNSQTAHPHQQNDPVSEIVDQTQLSEAASQMLQVENRGRVDTEDFMKFFQVDRLINPKYGTNKNPYVAE